MCLVRVTFVHDIWITRLQLNHGNFRQHVTCAHRYFFLHPIVGEQRVVHFIQIHVVQMCSIGFEHTVRSKYMQRFIILSQLVKTVWHQQSNRKCLKTYSFVSIDFFAIQKLQHIPSENVVIGCPRAFTLPHLIRIREAVFHQLQHRHNAFCCAFYAFNRFAACPQLRQVNGNTAADFGQLHASV
ncbi:hypothetical protein D1872_224600 [compost metagenome]